MLKIKDLNSYYGQVHALKGVSMEIPSGKITCIIGSNGAGKTTLLKSISGSIRRTGSILLNDSSELIHLTPQKVAKLYVAHVPEGRHIFPGLTVKENLETGTINWHGFFSSKPYEQELEEVYSLFPRLKERENQMGWSLSGGEQQMLAIGRALMSRPKLLMMDEPSMGLSPVIVQELFEKIVEINRKGMTILLVEQNARLAMQVSDYTYVIDQGRITLEGASAQMKNDPRIIKAYLGKFAENK